MYSQKLILPGNYKSLMILGFFCFNFYFSTWDLDIRLGFDLCKEEREFLDKRKKIVSETLRKALHLKESPPKDEVWSTVL